jgi:hypothetical protein
MFVRRLMLVGATALLAVGLLPLNASVTNVVVTPSSITFTSPDPSANVTGAPASTTVSFRTHANPPAFSLHVKAVTPNFTGCNAPPASAVTVTCSGASGLTCAGPAPLSNIGNGTTVATGGGNDHPASFVITYNFQDSWKYQQGASCSITTQIIYSEP